MSGDSYVPLAASIPEAAEAIEAAQRIVMACHVNPDGDALGSMLGLAHALSSLGKSLTLLSQDGVPEKYGFLPGVDLVRRTSDFPNFDLALVLDSGDLSRIGDHIRPIIGGARRVVDIDHHAVAGAFGDIRVLDHRAASTSEIVYALIAAMGIPLTPAIATCLFTGVITDTGSFRFQNVTPNTFRVAALLLEGGAPPAYVSENVFENRNFAATRLLGSALASLSQTVDGKIIWAHITTDDFAAAGATDEETEGVVTYVRGVRGANVGILFREIAAVDGEETKIRVSLRSRENVNVAMIAQKFGGGGHRMASGCTLAMPLAEAESTMIAAVAEAMKPAA